MKRRLLAQTVSTSNLAIITMLLQPAAAQISIYHYIVWYVMFSWNESHITHLSFFHPHFVPPSLPLHSYSISNYHPLEKRNLDQQGNVYTGPLACCSALIKGNDCLGVKQTTHHQSGVKRSLSESYYRKWCILMLEECVESANYSKAWAAADVVTSSYCQAEVIVVIM